MKDDKSCPIKWLKQNYPNVNTVDINYTFERFPNFVQKWILENWTKINDDNGGTYYNINWNIKGSNENNQKALDIMQKEGSDSAFKFMTTDPDTGKTLSYSEIRARFG